MIKRERDTQGCERLTFANNANENESIIVGDFSYSSFGGSTLEPNCALGTSEWSTLGDFSYDASYRFEAEDTFTASLNPSFEWVLVSTMQLTPVLRGSSGQVIYQNGAALCDTYPCNLSFLRIHEWDPTKQWCGVKTHALVGWMSGNFMFMIPSWHPIECNKP